MQQSIMKRISIAMAGLGIGIISWCALGAWLYAITESASHRATMHLAADRQ